MQTLLIVVTGLSVAVAALMSLVVLRMLREERRRSEARVAALREADAAEGVGTAPVPAPRQTPSIARAQSPVAHPTSHAARSTWHVARSTLGASHAARGTSHAARSTLDASHAARGTSHVARGTSHAPPAPSALFVEPERGPAWGARIAVAAGVLAVLMGLGFTILAPGGKGSGAAAAAAGPLELLTLRHAAEAGSLTVSGIVQNPRDGAPRRRLVVTASALAADGSVLATGRAPLDLAVFDPGEESPFVVAMPVTGPVARYRVGFRSDDGGVVPHVDRRTGAEAVAQK